MRDRRLHRFWLAAIEGSPAKREVRTKSYTIRTTSRLVLLDVSVKDPQGGFVTGLTQGQFQGL